MRMKWKKSTAAAVLLFGLAAVSLMVHSVSEIMAVTPVFVGEEQGLPTIVIDAGHGGFDGGATGVDGIVEKDLNLSIARKLYDLFTVNGFDAVLTRDSDETLEDPSLTTIRKRKNSDIHNRLELAKSYDNCILLSIHQNKFPQSQYFGAQVFYGPKNPQSEALAKITQRRMVEMLQPENTRQYKPCGDSVYLIYNAPMPALLIECGFLSNPDDAYKLIDADYQKKIAFAIFSSTAEYLGLQTPAEMAVYRELE